MTVTRNNIYVNEYDTEESDNEQRDPTYAPSSDEEEYYSDVDDYGRDPDYSPVDNSSDEEDEKAFNELCDMKDKLRNHYHEYTDEEVAQILLSIREREVSI